MKRALVWIFVVIALAAGAWAIIVARNQPAEVPFAKAMRESIVSSVPTNGKVEPIEWAEARAGRAGPVQKILIQRGQQVMEGAPLVELDSSEAKADLAVAQARVAQARADLEVLERGGRAADLAGISGELDRARLDLSAAKRDHDSLARLAQKQAATQYEVTQAQERVDRAEQQIRALEQKKSALVSSPDQASAEAKLKDAQAAVTLAQDRIRLSVVPAPVSGTVYQFDLRPGAYLNAGDLVAAIGRLDRVRVKVFVDEPDLGRVMKGLPVVITWDALPGHTWMGQVDRTPTEIVPLGTRQVGEVLCVIENPKNDLLPGTNVNAEIRTDRAANALTVPKEAIRHESGKTGVYVLEGQAVAWKSVTLGVNNTTRTQVDGLQDGDAVALPSGKPLKNGMVVSPVFP